MNVMCFFCNKIDYESLILYKLINNQSIMETLTLEQDFEPEGILNSRYKRIVKCTFSKTKSNSLYSIKQRIKNKQHQFITGLGIVLKVSLFMSLLIVVFS